MPRLLFAPIIPPLTPQLNSLLQFWHLSMTFPDFGKLAIQVSEEDKSEFFAFVLDFLAAASATEDEEEGGKEEAGCVPILFYPFGSYFFVSDEGAVCVDRAKTVIKIMHLLMAVSSPACSIEDHLKYGDYVNKLSLQFLSQRNSMKGIIPGSSYEAGLEFAMHSLGLVSQVKADLHALNFFLS